MTTPITLTPFIVGQQVRIDVPAMIRSNHWCKSPNYPSDDYLKKVQAMIAEHGPIGEVTHVFPPGYDLTVAVSGHAFHMKGHSWCFPLTEQEAREIKRAAEIKEHKADMVKFVLNLTGSVAQDLVAKVEDGRIPSDWDGHELRQLLADKFAHEATGGRWELKDARTGRGREYRNTVIVNNL